MIFSRNARERGPAQRRQPQAEVAGMRARSRRRTEPAARLTMRHDGPEFGPYDVSEAPDGRAGPARPGRAADPGGGRGRDPAGGRAAGRDPAGPARPRRQPAAAGRVRRAAHRGHLGRGPARACAARWSASGAKPARSTASTAPSCRPGSTDGHGHGRGSPRRHRRAALVRARRYIGAAAVDPDRAGPLRRCCAAWWSTGASRRGRSARLCRCGCRRRRRPSSPNWCTRARPRPPADVRARRGAGRGGPAGPCQLVRDSQVDVAEASVGRRRRGASDPRRSRAACAGCCAGSPPREEELDAEELRAEDGQGRAACRRSRSGAGSSSA